MCKSEFATIIFKMPLMEVSEAKINEYSSWIKHLTKNIFLYKIHLRMLVRIDNLVCKYIIYSKLVSLSNNVIIYRQRAKRPRSSRISK